MSLCDSMVVWRQRGIIMEIVMLSCFRTVGWRDRHAVTRAWRQKWRWLCNIKAEWGISYTCTYKTLKYEATHAYTRHNRVSPSQAVGVWAQGEGEMKSILILEFTHFKCLHLPANIITADQLPARTLLALIWCWYYLLDHYSLVTGRTDWVCMSESSPRNYLCSVQTVAFAIVQLSGICAHLSFTKG